MEYEDQTRLLHSFEMDHSLQPRTRTVQLWVAAAGGRHSNDWQSGVNVDLLLHCLYGVKPVMIGGKRYPTAVVPRCKPCHVTWRENHATIVEIAQHV